MRIVLAPDSFKESMSAAQAIEAMREGVRAARPDADCVGVPMADGGEGTVDAVVDALDGERVTVEVADALGRPVQATYGHVRARGLAVIEMAAAAGLELIAPAERDVLRAGTFGVGQLISDALDRGATEFLIGLGGSATNDGGAGMLTALGGRLYDGAGAPLPPGGAALADLDRIDLDGLDPRLSAVRIQLACDVTAPLLGPTGASAVFGPQKGASAADVARLEAALARFAEVADAAHAETPGAGAAGGLGFALLEFLGATSRPGVEVVAETVGLEQALRGAAWVLTGEGGVDAQTLMGKTPFGVAQVAARTGTRVAIFAGRVGDDASVLLEHGVDEIVGITPAGTPLERALREGPQSLARAVADFLRRADTESRESR
ncbi:glycerate kinase [Mycobacterium sp. IS-1742]|uniref:glycerate kinase n=1 Tax=Mycobacterium sp. IS-1742 TaxID=1772285 RepID=UPI000740284B|nr:glycerate kinase [Mycobacterium sp. IS-1742]KUI32233.1 glycerate kinase [Mycobacterium sp. IS-1742]